MNTRGTVEVTLARRYSSRDVIFTSRVRLQQSTLQISRVSYCIRNLGSTKLLQFWKKTGTGIFGYTYTNDILPSQKESIAAIYSIAF